jgi:hypothetical protein
MVSDVLARYYERSGIKLISPEEGCEAFLAEWSSLDLGAQLQGDPVTLRSWPFER